MKKEKYRDTLTLTYKMLNDDGKNLSKSAIFNNLSDEITDEDLFEIANMIKELLAYGTESIHRINDFLLLED